MNIILHSARHNPEVRFTLITNLNETHESWERVFGDMTKPSNVIFAPYTFEMIVREINKDNVGLGSTPIMIKNPYKLIDFKPMYGKIFQKELAGYTHWGWFDLDIHLGDVKRSYECDYHEEDFISYDNTRVHGPLMVNRNTEFVTTFYKNVLLYPDVFSMLQGARAILFDEVFMPHLIKKNQTVTLKRSHKRSCEGQEVYMWYKGEMQGSSGSCVIYHFGGG
eukprot:CAMPEP_0114481768 /NCGR_PEP_ID=MMETSP0104-20121206/17868_1 /TAXON_ID=37642 ORGANISM="Paraphysomonas imperforata, Strain PA2" /NCGR_SAMPLE_ID=MMETSP0104 /ASSEMBLY_ACC=CAM_ASM_000202 /LENGTH=221 /DNA_ID=CAMNT_0001657395 /DNA_START=96 /DNA_END=757 /DNA_ORIENTATION=-